MPIDSKLSHFKFDTRFKLKKHAQCYDLLDFIPRMRGVHFEKNFL